MSKNPLKIPCDKCKGKPTYHGKTAPKDADASEFFVVYQGRYLPRYGESRRLAGMQYYWKLTKYKGRKLCRDCLNPPPGADDENIRHSFDKCNVSAYSNNYQGGVFQ